MALVCFVELCNVEVFVCERAQNNSHFACDVGAVLHCKPLFVSSGHSVTCLHMKLVRKKL